MGHYAKAVDFIARQADPVHAVTIRNHAGRVMWMTGFKTDKGALLDGGLGDLAKSHGQFGALWRGIRLDSLERSRDTHSLLMDGICVDETTRGKGLGNALLDTIVGVARDRGPQRHALVSHQYKPSRPRLV